MAQAPGLGHAIGRHSVGQASAGEKESDGVHFIMNGGNFTNNYAKSAANGIIYVSKGADLTMNGGSILDNAFENQNGGIVYIADGGTISVNTAYSAGGGVNATYQGAVTMTRREKWATEWPRPIIVRTPWVGAAILSAMGLAWLIFTGKSAKRTISNFSCVAFHGYEPTRP